MNLLKRIHKLFDRLVGATYYYVTIDICPDYSGQGEMCSYTVKAKTMNLYIIVNIHTISFIYYHEHKYFRSDQ